MSKILRQMFGEEFVKKVLSGERDFSRVELEEGFDFSKGGVITQVNDYLEGQNLQKDPVDISNSKLFRIQAAELYLPFLRGEYADFSSADLRNVNLRNADLRHAEFPRADLRRAYLWRANFENAKFENADIRWAYLGNADLRYADLRHADLSSAELEGADFRMAYLWKTHFENADLSGADLRRVRNLDGTIGLNGARFSKTRVTAIERKIIEEALRGNVPFIEEE